MSRQFSYHTGAVTNEHVASEKLKSSPTTQLVSQIVLSGGRTIAYEYDAEERITKVTDSVGGVTTSTAYTYDALGQLLTETVNGAPVNVMTYDRYGNIASKNGVAYTYGDAVWKDLLTKVGDQPITYDAQGNPTTYLGHALTWEKGRQLKSFDDNSYTYNANGIRTSKTVGGVKHVYALDGTKILCETWNGNALVPLYDNEDGVCGILYNDEPYYFQKNLQGDVVAIFDKNVETVAHYSYDAWGVCTIVSDTSDIAIATVNPYRYRGYYYDPEIGMYYLQSRYYDPAVGRFVNGDDSNYIGKSETVLSADIFAYCENNAIGCTDITGCFGIMSIPPPVSFVYGVNNLIHYNYNRRNSPSGFIYNQGKGKAANLKFGFFNSSYNGCGWIATYNALILLGKNPRAEKIIQEYELTGAVIYGVFGIQPYAITHYFRFRGYKVTVTYNSKKFDSVARKNTANIIWFWHKSGAHYVALKWTGNAFTGYNTFTDSAGPDDWGKSISSYLRSQGWKATLLISVSKK